MANSPENNPGERVIPAMDSRQLMELLSKSEQELLVLILLELRQVKAATASGGTVLHTWNEEGFPSTRGS